MAEFVVSSADGTPISSQRYGEGRALVLVSGALSGSELWQRMMPLLSTERAVYAIDRRGRGKSGNSPGYAPEREIEDVLAVLAAIAGPLDLFGHSSGALLALQVAARAPQNLARLIAYEPPLFFADSDCIAEDLPERLEALLAQGSAEAAVETFFREGPRASDSELRAMKAGPAWAQMVKLFAHTVPYDCHVQRSFSRDLAQLSRVQVPTLMLFGGASPTRMQRGAQTLAARLPQARVSELAGQGHLAMLQAPPLLAAALKDFLNS